MSFTPINDWVLVQLEPIKEKPAGSIILPGPAPVRIARALKVGPGRHYGKGKKFIPTVVKPGDRFPFFMAATDTKNGRMVGERLPDDQELIRETDILFIIEEGDPEVSI